MTLLLYLALLGDSILRIVSSFEFHNKIKDVDVLESSGEVLRWAETETQGKYKERLSELGFFFFHFEGKAESYCCLWLSNGKLWRRESQTQRCIIKGPGTCCGRGSSKLC